MSFASLLRFARAVTAAVRSFAGALQSTDVLSMGLKARTNHSHVHLLKIFLEVELERLSVREQNCKSSLGLERDTQPWVSIVLILILLAVHVRRNQAELISN